MFYHIRILDFGFSNTRYKMFNAYYHVGRCTVIIVVVLFPTANYTQNSRLIYRVLTTYYIMFTRLCGSRFAGGRGPISWSKCRKPLFVRVLRPIAISYHNYGCCCRSYYYYCYYCYYPRDVETCKRCRLCGDAIIIIILLSSSQ